MSAVSIEVSRRRLLLALTGAIAAFLPDSGVALSSLSGWTTSTLEAFADTLIPGQRRFPGDYAIAGVVSGPGAVQAGALDVMTMPELPLRPVLPTIANLLNLRATGYALDHAIVLPITRPPLAGLSYTHRIRLVEQLFQQDSTDRPLWQVMALVVGLAFDTAADGHTAQEVRSNHPGLTWLGFPEPDPDGLWRFPRHSYEQALASPHPRTTPSGSPE